MTLKFSTATETVLRLP